MPILPIPKHLLIHTIVYEAFINEDGWGRREEEYDEPITIENVLVQPREKKVLDSNAKGVEYITKVFVDRQNSSKYPRFVVGSKIHFNGKEYELSEVHPIYDINPDLPHHYELVIK